MNKEHSLGRGESVHKEGMELFGAEDLMHCLYCK